jgi:hypothetical protein
MMSIQQTAWMVIKPDDPADDPYEEEDAEEEAEEEAEEPVPAHASCPGG